MDLESVVDGVDVGGCGVAVEGAVAEIVVATASSSEKRKKAMLRRHSPKSPFVGACERHLALTTVITSPFVSVSSIIQTESSRRLPPNNAEKISHLNADIPPKFFRATPRATQTNATEATGQSHTHRARGLCSGVFSARCIQAFLMSLTCLL